MVRNWYEKRMNSYHYPASHGNNKRSSLAAETFEQHALPQIKDQVIIRYLLTLRLHIVGLLSRKKR